MLPSVEAVMDRLDNKRDFRYLNIPLRDGDRFVLHSFGSHKDGYWVSRFPPAERGGFLSGQGAEFTRQQVVDLLTQFEWPRTADQLLDLSAQFPMTVWGWSGKREFFCTITADHGCYTFRSLELNGRHRDDVYDRETAIHTLTKWDWPAALMDTQKEAPHGEG